jgi:hypothetical protein
VPPVAPPTRSPRQPRGIEVRACLDRARIEHTALQRRVDAARQRYGGAITPLPDLDDRQLRAADDAAADVVLSRVAASGPCRPAAGWLARRPPAYPDTSEEDRRNCRGGWPSRPKA